MHWHSQTLNLDGSNKEWISHWYQRLCKYAGTHKPMCRSSLPLNVLSITLFTSLVWYLIATVLSTELGNKWSLFSHHWTFHIRQSTDPKYKFEYLLRLSKDNGGLSNHATTTTTNWKNNRFNDQHNSSARALRFLVHFFDVHCTPTTWNLLIWRFMENADKQRRIFRLLCEPE